MDTILLRKRLQSLESERSNLNGTFDLIERFVLPFKGDFTNGFMSEGEINWRKRELMDSTAVLANQNLAANIHSGLTNPVVRWFDIRFRNNRLNKDQDAMEWLDDSSERVFVTLQESNFNLEVNETYLDLTSFGTSVLVEEVEETVAGNYLGLDFRSTPMSECYFQDDHKGNVVYFFRKMNWTPLQIKEKFGDKIPEDIRKMVESASDGDRREEVVFAIYPRDQYRKQESSPLILPPTTRPFGYKYFLYKDGTMLGEEGGYYEMPAFVPRWRKTTGSKWGHSPAMVCLSDILTLNELVKLVTKAAEKVIDPPILTTRKGVFGDIDIDAGGVTVVSSMDAFKPYESGARFDVSALTKADLQQSIRQSFFMDQLQLKESPAMTATEVSVRYEMMQRLMGPTLSRLQYDFLDPLVQRTFRILYRHGQLEKPPQIVQDAQAEFDVEYTGPMARAQKADQVTALERWLGTIGQLSELYPQLRDLPDVDECGRGLGLLGGVPPKFMKGQAAVNTERKKQEAAMKQAREMDQAEQASKIIDNVGGVIGGGNGQQAAAA